MKVKSKICLITYPRTSASIAPLTNVVDILNSVSSFLYLITGNDGEIIFKNRPNLKGCCIIYKSRSFILGKIAGHLKLQLRIMYEVVRVNKKVDCYIFFMGDSLLFPALICKITRKPVIWVIAGSLKNIFENDITLATKIFIKEENINYFIANRIVIYSTKLIKEWELGKYKSKISIAHEHFIDSDKFKNFKKINTREYVIGYLGRLSEEKGALNFIKAIPYVIKERDDVKFIVGGDGPLKRMIDSYIFENNLNAKVKLAGWISHEELPMFLNQLKLIVLPSYTEGLPNVMLEAMACGTPILAKSIGAIPDIIIDSENGFLMDDNSPICIALNILRALNYHDTDRISENGRMFIEKEFTFENAVANYREILNI